MNRSQLQHLASEYLADAAILLANQRWARAYYLAGYAVEVGLKSCVLAHIEATGRIFDEKEYLKDLAQCWTHDLSKLIKVSHLLDDLNIRLKSNLNFAAYWGVVNNWDESSRSKPKSQAQAELLWEAITQQPDGILAWITKSW